MDLGCAVVVDLLADWSGRFGLGLLDLVGGLRFSKETFDAFRRGKFRFQFAMLKRLELI